MCSNYVGQESAKKLAEQFHATLIQDFNTPPRIFPRYTAPVLVVMDGETQVVPMQFGMIAPWEKNPRPKSVQYNARSETAATLPWFRDAFHTRRCLVPMDGFYEWIWTSDTEKWLAYFHPVAGGVLAAAGIWGTWKSPAGERIDSFTILTREPPTFISATGHDRCPVFLPQSSWRAWLEPVRMESADLDKILRHPLPVEWMVTDATAADQAAREQAKKNRAKKKAHTEQAGLTFDND